MNRCGCGRKLVLDALDGKVTKRIPVGLFTWGFEYIWKVGGIPPWKLACGNKKIWHDCYMANLLFHRPDLIWYDGSESGDKEPTLVNETEQSYFIRDNNTNTTYELIKTSLTLKNLDTGKKNCDPVERIESISDADRNIPEFSGRCSGYRNGLKELISEVGNRALVLPHHSPAYICACYALGFENAMRLMITDEDLFLYVCEKYSRSDYYRMKELADAGAEAVFIADGWASSDIISPQMFKKFALPYQNSMIDAAHQAGLRVILWNEGDVLDLLKLEAQLDMDAFAFEQPRKGVDLTVNKVRKVFGSNRCLFGNLDSEQLLLRNDPEEIRREVANQIHQSGKGNPFILSTGSPIPSNIEPSAINAMIKAVKNES